MRTGKQVRQILFGGTHQWHFLICLAGLVLLAALPAVRLTSRRKSPLLAALPAARLASRRKSLPLAVLPAALATSNSTLTPGKASPC